MKTFTSAEAAQRLHSHYHTQAARQLCKLYDTKALLGEVEAELHPVSEDDLAARAALADIQIDAMDSAEEASTFLNTLVQQLLGTEIWSKAMEIAYAPIEQEGYLRVAEYYRRAQAIHLL
jgi:hypothetical protein